MIAATITTNRQIIIGDAQLIDAAEAIFVITIRIPQNGGKLQNL
jgi:hypothetical protein